MRPRVFWAILTGLALYTGLQASRMEPSRPVAAWLATFGFLAFAWGWFFAYRGRRERPSSGRRAHAWAGSIALGVWATFILLSLPADLERLAAPLASPRAQALALLAAAVVLAVLGLGQALAGPRVREIEIPVPERAAALRGLRIVQLSDLHVGPTIDARYVEDVVRKAMALAPDLIALTGDLVDGTVEVLSEQVRPLAGLRAPLGVYFVTGNHEYYSGAESWLAKYRELGLRPLLDEGVVVAARGEKLLVGGVVDPAARHFTPARRGEPKAAAEGAEECSYRILLAHRPDPADAAAAAGFDLQLSGHTHGGQFFPFSLLVRLAHRYVRGLHRHKDALWVYVNPGTGYWGPPHRFGVPAEITLLRLV